jgi:carbon storage regulator
MGLVLKRKLGERIVINGNVFVQVVEAENGTARLHIVAPEGVVVDREEVHNERVRNNPQGVK